MKRLVQLANAAAMTLPASTLLATEPAPCKTFRAMPGDYIVLRSNLPPIDVPRTRAWACDPS